MAPGMSIATCMLFPHPFPHVPCSFFMFLPFSFCFLHFLIVLDFSSLFLIYPCPFCFMFLAFSLFSLAFSLPVVCVPCLVLAFSLVRTLRQEFELQGRGGRLTAKSKLQNTKEWAPAPLVGKSQPPNMLEKCTSNKKTDLSRGGPCSISPPPTSILERNRMGIFQIHRGA